MSQTFKQKIVRDFSRSAKKYDTYAILQRKVSERLFDLLNHLLYLDGLKDDHKKHSQNQVCDILEIGCGTGYFHELLRRNKISSSLLQVDISPEMCALAASYASPANYGATYTAICDMHELPFAGNTFATIFSSMTMQWSESLGKVFQEAGRVLGDNGKFVFSLVGSGSLYELREAFSRADVYPPVHTFASLDEVKEKLIQAGLAEIECYSETITMHYDNLHSLLRSIKNVGASYKLSECMGLRGKGYFTEVEAIYNKLFKLEKGLPLSWNILYFLVTSQSKQ